MKQTSRRLFLVAAYLIFTSHAQADIGKIGGPAIGKIGSPVVPSNMPKKAAVASDTASTEDAPAESDDKPERQPLLVIPFTQRRMNYDRALNQAIIVNERNAPGSMYEVVATIPTGSNARMNDIYAANLDGVLSKMQNAGLGADRIRTSTEYKDSVGEDIYIYAK